MRNFTDRLIDEIDKYDNPSCIGLDPRIDEIPTFLAEAAMKECDVKPGDISNAAWAASARAIEMFNERLIDATHDLVPGYKLQWAFYEPFKEHGVRAFEKTANYAKSKGKIVIGDGKRNDIADTAEAYADAHLGVVGLVTGVYVSGLNEDALTVTPYLGSDGLRPFIDVCKRFGKGIFVLTKTSNNSGVEIQDLMLAENHGGRRVFEQVALKAEILGRDLLGKRGYSSVGIVVGATGNTPEELRQQAKRIRELNPFAITLVPAYGQQGGTAKDTVPAFTGEGYGAIVNNSRGIMFAYQREPYKDKYRPEEFEKASRDATLAMKDDMRNTLKASGFRRWV